MAKIKEEILIVKVSTLLKNNSDVSEDVFTSDICDTLEEAISDMVGSGHIVEITKE